MAQARALPPPEGRPRTRAECIDGPRPCPWLTCAHHLLPDRTRVSGELHANAAAEGPCKPLHAWTPSEVAEGLRRMPATCALDVAAAGGRTLGDVGRVLGVTREAVRQIEVVALARMARAAKRRGIER